MTDIEIFVIGDLRPTTPRLFAQLNALPSNVGLTWITWQQEETAKYHNQRLKIITFTDPGEIHSLGGITKNLKRQLFLCSNIMSSSSLVLKLRTDVLLSDNIIEKLNKFIETYDNKKVYVHEFYNKNEPYFLCDYALLGSSDNIQRLYTNAYNGLLNVDGNSKDRDLLAEIFADGTQKSYKELISSEQLLFFFGTKGDLKKDTNTDYLSHYKSWKKVSRDFAFLPSEILHYPDRLTKKSLKTRFLMWRYNLPMNSTLRNLINFAYRIRKTVKNDRK